MTNLTQQSITDEQMAIVKEKYQSMSRSALAKLIGVKVGKLGHNMFIAGLRANEHLGKVSFKEEKEGMFNEKEYLKTLY